MPLYKKGLVTRLSGGFYYVTLEDGEVVETRARGIFRKDKNNSPMVGDNVNVEMTSEGVGRLSEVVDRRNYLIRPPVANIDLLVMVISMTAPLPNLPLIDKLLAVAIKKGIEPIIVFTKTDLEDPSKISEIYRKSGFVVMTSEIGSPPEGLLDLMAGKLCVFSGNTGVGKSTLLNELAPELNLQTGEVSKKLGRGRHTTRTTEIFKIGEALIADTPGFSSLETVMLEVIFKDELEDCFPEFQPYLGLCQFTGCSHTKEKGCKVIKAVEEGIIPKTRFDSYVIMYEEAKQIKEWEVNRKVDK